MKKNINIIKTVITVLVVISITSFVYDYLMRRKEHSRVYGYEGFENDGDKKDRSCDKNTPVDPMKSFAATISYYTQSQLESSPLEYKFDTKKIKDGDKEYSIPVCEKGDILVKDVLDKIKPIQTLTFTWEDPNECFTYIKDSTTNGGKKIMNTATDFEITNKTDGSHELSFTQNAGKCCAQFDGKDGDIKKYNSKVLTLDEESCKQDKCMFIALTAIKFPDHDDDMKCDDAKLCTL